MTPRIGSMCTGYGGLDTAVHEVFGGTVAWHAEIDPDASKVLAHRFPRVPNLGDLTAQDWSQVEPVDIVTAGFPCQDISYAGRGAGIQEGNRSGLWHTIADALSALRPRIVILENVRAIVVRRPGLDVVLADLARLGFDAVWTCVRASDVGAPHRRERWFLVAHANGGPAAGPGVVAPSSGRTNGIGTAKPGRGDRTASDAHLDELARQRQEQPGGSPAAGSGDVAWGKYGPAIRRWVRILGRPAPLPREHAPQSGGERLSPPFVEWMQGLPAGGVTDVPGITRDAQLRILGNGVVPQQAAYGLRILLAHLKEAAA